MRDSRPAGRLGRLLELPVDRPRRRRQPDPRRGARARRATRSTPICSRRAPTTCCACAACRCATPASSKATCSRCTAPHDARTGQIVVARLADEVTVKRLRRRGHAVQLDAGESGFRADRSRPAARRARHRRHRGRRDPQRQESVRSLARRRDNSRGFAYRIGAGSLLRRMNHSTHRQRHRRRARGLDQRVEAEIRDRADPQQVLADRVAQLYRQMPIAIAATFVVGADRHLRAAGPLAEGAGADLVGGSWLPITAARQPAALRLPPQRGQGRRPRPQWLRWLGIAALGNGASWGFAGGGVLPLARRRAAGVPRLPASPAWLSVGIPVYAASWPIFALYAAGILGAVLLRAAPPSAIGCSSRSRCWCRCSTPSTSPSPTA